MADFKVTTDAESVQIGKVRQRRSASPALVADILSDLNRRVSELEMDSEGGGYEAGESCAKQIEKGIIYVSTVDKPGTRWNGWPVSSARLSASG